MWLSQAHLAHEENPDPAGCPHEHFLTVLSANVLLTVSVHMRAALGGEGKHCLLIRDIWSTEHQPEGKPAICPLPTATWPRSPDQRHITLSVKSLAHIPTFTLLQLFPP